MFRLEGICLENVVNRLSNNELKSLNTIVTIEREIRLHNLIKKVKEMWKSLIKEKNGISSLDVPQIMDKNYVMRFFGSYTNPLLIIHHVYISVINCNVEITYGIKTDDDECYKKCSFFVNESDKNMCLNNPELLSVISQSNVFVTSDDLLTFLKCLVDLVRL